MTPAAALVALACWAPPPAPAVTADVMAALQGLPAAAAAPAKGDVALAIRAAAALRKARR
ncbi:hypothetical protein ACQKJ1_26445 [Methylorubrum rhodesianum]|uniref:hypothetical protein n=1 Tax=Methylorubrum rhodesianum TaxID=29427 RepID=UPI003D018859